MSTRLLEGFRLRELSASARLGLTGLLLTLVGGFAASAQHLILHHENRDERPGLSQDDLLGAYHGVETTAPMVLALERGHPETLSDTDSELLLGWLTGERISDDYDNLDLGDSAPAEVIANQCLECHARSSTEGDGIGQTVPLEYWDDVERVSFSRSISPTALPILVASTHTHAIALATLSLVLAILLLLTRWPAALTHGLIGLSGIGLFLDLGGWWLVRSTPSLLLVLIAAGALYGLASVTSALLVLAELWLPKSRA